MAWHCPCCVLALAPSAPALFGTFFPNRPRNFACNHSNLHINLGVHPPSFRDRSCVELCFFHSGLASFALMSSEFPGLYFLFGSFFPFLTPPVSEKMLPNKTWLCRRCIMLKLRSLTIICYCCCPWLPLLGASAFLCLLREHGMDENLTSGDLRFLAQENLDEFRHFLHSMTFVF